MDGSSGSIGYVIVYNIFFELEVLKECGFYFLPLFMNIEREFFYNAWSFCS